MTHGVGLPEHVVSALVEELPRRFAHGQGDHGSRVPCAMKMGTAALAG